MDAHQAVYYDDNETTCPGEVRVLCAVDSTNTYAVKDQKGFINLP
jgi:hypothetical protein